VPALIDVPQICARFDGTVIECSAPHLDRELHDACAVWVSSDLRWFAERPHADCYALTDVGPMGAPCLVQHPCWARMLARDVTQTDEDQVRRIYRRLDPLWYRWLHQATCRARAAHAAGGPPDDQHWQTIRERMNALWRWAREHAPECLADLAAPLPVEYRRPMPGARP
jgi:hypothetical protein